MSKNVPNMMKDMNLHIKKSKIQSRVNLRDYYLRYNQNVKKKKRQKSYKTARERQITTSKGFLKKKIKADFSS